MLSYSQNTGRNMASLLCEISDESSSFQAWRRLLCTPQTVNIKLQIISIVMKFRIQTFFCQSNIFAWTVDIIHLLSVSNAQKTHTQRKKRSSLMALPVPRQHSIGTAFSRVRRGRYHGRNAGMELAAHYRPNTG